MLQYRKIININPSIKFYKHMSAVSMDEWTVYRLTGEHLKDLAREFEK